MRRTTSDIVAIAPHMGAVLFVFGIVMFSPVLFVFAGPQAADLRPDALGEVNALVFLIPGGLAVVVGIVLRNFVRVPEKSLTLRQAMLLCTVSWVVVTVIGAFPIRFGTPLGNLDSLFETMSGLTTTGITMLSGEPGFEIDVLPRSVLFWRALIQWIGGLGILAMFLVVAFTTGVAHQLYGAESHKVASKRPRPGLASTLKIFWAVYIVYTVVIGLLLFLEGLGPFDALTHSLTAISTGGYSTHDASIAFYRVNGYTHADLIEWTIIVGMFAGGVNFLVHYRLFRGEIRALWDTMEVRYLWGIMVLAVGLVLLEPNVTEKVMTFHDRFRDAVFQVIALLTTTGFGTRNIITDYGPVAKQVFLVLMVVGGCVGSTGGGFKVFRIAVLARMVKRQLFLAVNSRRRVNVLYVDGQPLPEEEVRRASALFFAWIALLLIGGLATALLSEHGALESVSGMASALGNIGPCYISNAGLTTLHPVVKVVYILGMLAGRLEILPVLLLFSVKTWR